MGIHLRVHNESYPMNTNMTGFRWLSKSLHPCALDESSLSIGRVNNLAIFTLQICIISPWYKISQEGVMCGYILFHQLDRTSFVLFLPLLLCMRSYCYIGEAWRQAEVILRDNSTYCFVSTIRNAVKTMDIPLFWI